METTRERMTRACVDGLCTVMDAHPDWLAQVRAIAGDLHNLAPDVRWARAMRAWADGEMRAVAEGREPYPDALAAAIGYSSFLKGDDWDRVLARLDVLADA